MLTNTASKLCEEYYPLLEKQSRCTPGAQLLDEFRKKQDTGRTFALFSWKVKLIRPQYSILLRKSLLLSYGSKFSHSRSQRVLLQQKGKNVRLTFYQYFSLWFTQAESRNCYSIDDSLSTLGLQMGDQIIQGFVT